MFTKDHDGSPANLLHEIEEENPFDFYAEPSTTSSIPFSAVVPSPTTNEPTTNLPNTTQNAQNIADKQLVLESLLLPAAAFSGSQKSPQRNFVAHIIIFFVVMM